LIAGELLITVGVAGKMHALRKSDGKVVWSRDLWGDDLGGNFLPHGYASSPVAYEDTVIVPVGGQNAGVVAFDLRDGRVKWKAFSFRNSYSSPRILRMDVEEIWSTRRIQFYHASSVQDGDWVYASSGTSGPSFLVAVNILTGEIGWRERGFAKANCVGADGKLVILDEDGMLYLARATPDELVVQAKTQLLHGTAWTVPTIVGKTLYARDNSRVLAVALGF
jgi:hypothetical protein